MVSSSFSRSFLFSCDKIFRHIGAENNNFPTHLEHGRVGPEQILVPGQGENLHLVPEPILYSITRIAPLGTWRLFETVTLVSGTRIVWLLDSTPSLGGDQDQPDVIDVGVIGELVVAREILVLPAHHLQHPQALLRRHIPQALTGVR